MPFLQRSNSNRLKKSASVRGNVKDQATSTTVELCDTMDEAVDEHRRSMVGRPRSAGVDHQRRKKSTNDRTADVGAAGTPKCLQDLQRSGQVIEYTSGLGTFNFPRPSPRMPPRTATFHQKSTAFPGPPPRSVTFQESPSPLQYDDSPQIGIAIGTPSMAPPNWGRSYTADHISNRMPQRRPPNRPPPALPEEASAGIATEQSKKKSRSWKTLFLLPSKRNTRDIDPKLEPVQAHTTALLREHPRPRTNDPPVWPDTPMSCLAPPTEAGTGPRSLSDVDSSNPLRIVLSPKRTSFMPRGLKSPVKWKSATPSMTPKLRASDDIIKQQVERHDSPMADNDFDYTLQRTPRLDLHLPETEFPRYSVMFEKLLNGDSKPSLLERRQSRLPRTKSQKGMDEGEDSLLVRTNGAGVKRALTSPHLTRPLSIRIDGKPLPEDTSTAVRRPRPLVRSKTAPSAAISPRAAGFMRSSNLQEQVDSSTASPGSTISSEMSVPVTPTTVMTDASSIKRALDQHEPVWHMITSKPLAVSDQQQQDDDPCMSIESPGRSKMYPRVRSSDELERNIVQVSVARQVSVSRARTRVQRASQVAARPLRPRVVELTKNRKSTAGVLEDMADEPLPEGAASVVHSRAASQAASIVHSRATSQAASIVHSRSASQTANVVRSRSTSQSGSVKHVEATKAEPMPEDAHKKVVGEATILADAFAKLSKQEVKSH